MQHLDDIALEARIIGVVNTVRREGDRWIGENTDGKGFMRGLTKDAGIDPIGKKVVILGAGGAARESLSCGIFMNSTTVKWPILQDRPLFGQHGNA